MSRKIKEYNYHYTYRITNIVEKKYYYGVHSCNCLPKEDIGVKYFSSSKNKVFKQDIKTNPQNYKYKVIKIFSSRKEALEHEIYLHNRFDVGRNKSFYNGSKQTSTGFDTSGITFNKGMMAAKNIETLKIEYISTPLFYESNKYIAVSKGRIMTKDQKIKLSLAKIGKPSQFKYLTYDERYGEVKSKEIKNKLSKSISKLVAHLNNFYGKTHSIETKRKISEKNKGKAVFINDLGEKIYMPVDEAKKNNFDAESKYRKYSDEVNKKKGRSGELNHNFGKHLSKEIREKISTNWHECREKFECNYCLKPVLKHHKRFHFENCKLRIKREN